MSKQTRPYHSIQSALEREVITYFLTKDELNRLTRQARINDEYRKKNEHKFSKQYEFSGNHYEDCLKGLTSEYAFKKYYNFETESLFENFFDKGSDLTLEDANKTRIDIKCRKRKENDEEQVDPHLFINAEKYHCNRRTQDIYLLLEGNPCLDLFDPVGWIRYEDVEKFAVIINTIVNGDVKPTLLVTSQYLRPIRELEIDYIYNKEQ